MPRFLFVVAGALVWTSADGQRQRTPSIKRPEAARVGRPAAPQRPRANTVPLPELCLDSSSQARHAPRSILLK